MREGTPAACMPARRSASSAVALTDPAGSAFMPLFSPDGFRLLFLSQQAAVESGVHNATSSLHSLPWPLVRPSPSCAARY
jgi:hypothetical protein